MENTNIHKGYELAVKALTDVLNNKKLSSSTPKPGLQDTMLR